MAGSVRGLPVVTRAEGTFAGKLDDLLVFIENLSVIGFKIRSPSFFGSPRGVAAGAVERLGRDYVIVRAESDIEDAGASRGSLDDRVWWSDWHGVRCMSRRGAELGRLHDLVLLSTGARVCGFLLDGNRLITPGPTCAVGADSLIVDDESAIVKVEASPDTDAWWQAVEALLAASGAPDAGR